ncbi:hypothetical protein HY991_03380 [Candidatus Micrarchaeota archaeon]|nr:hypothetical protein [Candidatus Micrarchaeota archaeon]
MEKRKANVWEAVKAQWTLLKRNPTRYLLDTALPIPFGGVIVDVITGKPPYGFMEEEQRKRELLLLRMERHPVYGAIATRAAVLNAALPNYRAQREVWTGLRKEYQPLTAFAMFQEIKKGAAKGMTLAEAKKRAATLAENLPTRGIGLYTAVVSPRYWEYIISRGGAAITQSPAPSLRHPEVEKRLHPVGQRISVKEFISTRLKRPGEGRSRFELARA